MVKRISKELENKIVELYKQGKGTCNIAKDTDLNRWTVLQYVKSAGLNPQRITRPYKNTFNIKYFSEYNKETAYWAGFIMADGNIRDKEPKYYLQIGLSEKDKGHLKKFAEAINFTGTLYEYEKGKAVSIQVRGRWFIEDLLNKYGIVERKSLIACFPKDLPKDLYSHFIRGYFDGDGSINSIKNKSSPVVSFVGCEYIIETMRDILHDTLNLSIYNDPNHKAPLHSVKNPKVKQFAYSGDNARKILQWLYDGSTEDTRLDRKYKRYLEWAVIEN